MKTRRISLIAFVVVTAVAVWFGMAGGARSTDELTAEAFERLETKQYRQVEVLLEDLAGRSEASEAVAILRAAMQIRSGRVSAGVDLLQDVDEDGPYREWRWLLNGEALVKLNKPAEAETWFRALATENNENVDAHRWLGILYYDVGDIRQAEREMHIVADLAPRDFRPHLLLAQIYADAEEFEIASAAYRNVLDRDPFPGVVRKTVPELARCLIKQREYQQAIDVIDAHSGSARLLAMKSESLLGLGNPAGARAALEQAKRYDPDDLDLLLLEVKLLRGAGDYAASIPPLQRLVNRTPDDYNSRLQLSLALRRVGRTEEADAEFDRMQLWKERYDRSVALYQQAQDEPRNVAIREQLAAVCYELGKPELAAMWQRAAATCREQVRLDREYAEQDSK